MSSPLSLRCRRALFFDMPELFRIPRKYLGQVSGLCAVGARAAAGSFAEFRASSRLFASIGDALSRLDPSRDRDIDS